MFPPDTPRPINTAEGWKQEYEAARAWDRPVRSYYTDTPYYPWAPMPKQPFSVSFKLGYK